MEEFALYLLRSVIWLTAFAMVYIVFLRNERYFGLNRLFLLSGLFAAVLFPFITFSYKVLVPVDSGMQAAQGVPEVVQVSPGDDSGSLPGIMLLAIYITGILFVAYTICRQSQSLLTAIRKSGPAPAGSVKLVRSDRYGSSFSFFSWVFVNPSINDIEMREIMNHEMVHIRQRHWFDLMTGGLLCMVQWFNPVVWLYMRLIRQNHEYIADKVALQRTSDPAVYRAALLNQIVGAGVVSLTNSFNYSLNKKRFDMMENIFSPPYRKLKLLLMLPVFTLLFYAFARPDYQYTVQDNGQTGLISGQEKSGDKISGRLVMPDGKPLRGANIVVVGTTTGTVSDEQGNFSLAGVPEDAALAITYVGFKSKVIKSEFAGKVPIKMERDTIDLDLSHAAVPPPPPPPPPPSEVKDKSAALSPPSQVIEELNTGEQGKNEKVYVVVEELPEFPGGNAGMQVWMKNNLKHPVDPVYGKLTGTVFVTFIVTGKGKISTPVISKSVNPLLDLEAMRLVASMPDWKPGTQNGRNVDVQMKLPVEF